MHVCFVVFVLVFQYVAKRLAVKNVSEMTYFVSRGTSNLHSISHCCTCIEVLSSPCKMAVLYE